MKSLYLRKDYSAACPAQHIAYLKCMKDSKSWLPFQGSICQDEWKAFAVCKNRAKAANIKPTEGAEAAGERPSFYALLWQDFQREPAVMAAKMAWRENLAKLGLGDYFGSSSSSDGQSTGSSEASGSSTS